MEQPIHQFDSSPRNKALLIPVFVSIVLTAIIVGGGMFWWMSRTNDELLEVKFRLAIRDFWNIREVFRNPQKKNQFYYISGDSSGYYIWVYDIAHDTTYQKNGSFNIPEGNTLLFNQKLAQYQEFRGVGFSENKFVFSETGVDNSPNPCFSPWFYSNLEYIDLEVSNPTRKPFTLPDAIKRSEEQKVSECQKTL